jgi:hypothetical protein
MQWERLSRQASSRRSLHHDLILLARLSPGLRMFLPPGYASARWHLENNCNWNTWDQPTGRNGLDASPDWSPK